MNPRSDAGLRRLDSPAGSETEILQRLLGATATRIGQDFLLALVRELSLGCGADIALVGTLDFETPGQITTLAVSNRGNPVANFSYSTSLTPCERAIGKGIYIFPSGVSAAFPKFALPGTSAIDSYMGAVLKSSTGKPIGILALLHSRTLERPAVAESLLQAVAARASAELEREQTLDALRESDTFLRLTQRVGKCGSWEWNLATNRVRWSDELCRLHGLEPGAFGGTLEAAVEFIVPEDRDEVGEGIRRIVQDHLPIPIEYRVRRADGEIRWLWGHGEMLKDSSGRQTRVVGNVMDITNRKQAEFERQALEEKVRHAQRLESLGVLAGGIAHDFNNLLTSMLGYANLAGKTLPGSSPARPYLDEVARAAARAAELTHQMLAYAGKGRIVVEPVSLDALVREMHGLLRTVVSKKAVTRLDLGAATVEADAAQIRQVVMNLITNASDALGTGTGEITIRTGEREMSTEELSSPYLKAPLLAGRYAWLEVSDTGVGMDPDTAGKIFDPFFTTKSTGRGLGLAAALGIVRGHRGSIQVSSAPGRGSTFRVLLPATAARAGRPVEAARPREGHPGVLLLVVDDEESVRTFIRIALESEGYRVATAGDGQEGIEAFAARRGEFKAVILDLTMPRMDGWELLSRMRALEPDLPVVLTSGYTEPSAPPTLGQDLRPFFVQKPFLPEVLLAKVQQALATRPGKAAP